MLIGTIVMVIVDHPDGSTKNTFGEIGVVTKIEHHATYETDYTVHNHSGDYLYGKNQIRELTDEECRDALYNELTR